MIDQFVHFRCPYSYILLNQTCFCLVFIFSHFSLRSVGDLCNFCSGRDTPEQWLSLRAGRLKKDGISIFQTSIHRSILWQKIFHVDGADSWKSADQLFQFCVEIDLRTKSFYPGASIIPLDDIFLEVLIILVLYRVQTSIWVTCKPFSLFSASKICHVRNVLDVT